MFLLQSHTFYNFVYTIGVNINAVVADVCDMNSENCGIDMIGRTWNKATNNQFPGITSCSVELTAINPLQEATPVCYRRPGSESNNRYWVAVGVLNKGARIASNAVLAGRVGVRNNDNWFMFDSRGQPLFGADATVIFNFEDGSSSVSFRLSECRWVASAQIFR